MRRVILYVDDMVFVEKNIATLESKVKAQQEICDGAQGSIAYIAYA